MLRSEKGGYAAGIENASVLNHRPNVGLSILALTPGTALGRLPGPVTGALREIGRPDSIVVMVFICHPPRKCLANESVVLKKGNSHNPENTILWGMS
jgi:hypothetical protein